MACFFGGRKGANVEKYVEANIETVHSTEKGAQQLDSRINFDIPSPPDGLHARQNRQMAKRFNEECDNHETERVEVSHDGDIQLEVKRREPRRTRNETQCNAMHCNATRRHETRGAEERRRAVEKSDRYEKGERKGGRKAHGTD